jgi:predicted transcriptional regulator
MNANERTMLTMIAAAIRAGRQCPTNDDFCQVMGFASWASAARLMQKLQQAGLVTVDRRSSSRDVVLTEAGRARLAGLAEIDRLARQNEVTATPREFYDVQSRKPAPVLHSLPSIGNDDERAGRKAAAAANARFLQALARVTPVPDAPDPDRGRFQRLPPPALIGQASS